MHSRFSTLRDFYIDLANSLSSVWTEEWWSEDGPSSIIVAANGQTWDAKNPDASCPSGIQGFGWGGSDVNGRLWWVGWDLDVGHGVQSYMSTDLALSDAFRLRDFLNGQAEIRLSKSGQGVHIRHRLPDDENRSASDGPRIAKGIAAKLGLRADPSALGRQCFIFWSSKTNKNSFRLILPHEGMEDGD